MQRESLNETREQSREDKGEDGEKKMRPPPLRAKEKKRKKKVSRIWTNMQSLSQKKLLWQDVQKQRQNKVLNKESL